MFRFVGKLLVMILIGFIWGAILGAIFDSPQIGVAFFLIFTVSFRRAVFEPISRD